VDDQNGDLALLSCVMNDPASYGRIVRDASGRLTGIREARDLANDAERTIREINAGVYVVRVDVLEAALSELRPTNAQGEYYLTDIVPYANRHGGALALVGNERALVGVNDRAELVQAEAMLFERIRHRHALAGVTIRGDACIDDTVELAPDVEIQAGVVLRGTTRVGRGTRVDVGSVLTNMVVGEDCVIRPYTVMTDSTAGNRAEFGPFTHVRPSSTIDDDAHLGNFVETKKTHLRRGAKANHLAYLGDGDIGERANVGAGTIFCNYDGFGKNLTTIGDDAFIGSDSQLVAPVTVGRGAYVATGTTVTKNVPDDALAIARTRQENKPGYAAKLRARLKARSGK
jgi:bifunctional UDP-N-acetylglucosamine pyrophosphorylase/glucosamine-1-phosphate N-acetyltransferase